MRKEFLVFRLFVSLLLAVLFTGCKSTSSVHERDDLITIAHNAKSDYTLIVYRSEAGRMRKVLRKGGICELLLIETDKGQFLLKERGQEPRKLSARNVLDLESNLQDLIYNNTAPAIQAPGIQGSS